MTPPRLKIGQEGAETVIVLNMTLIWAILVTAAGALLWIGRTVSTVNERISALTVEVDQMDNLQDAVSVFGQRVIALEERGRERTGKIDGVDARVRPIEAEVRVLSERQADMLEILRRMEIQWDSHVDNNAIFRVPAEPQPKLPPIPDRTPSGLGR